MACVRACLLGSPEHRETRYTAHKRILVTGTAFSKNIYAFFVLSRCCVSWCSECKAKQWCRLSGWLSHPLPKRTNRYSIRNQHTEPGFCFRSKNIHDRDHSAILISIQRSFISSSTIVCDWFAHTVIHAIGSLFVYQLFRCELLGSCESGSVWVALCGRLLMAYWPKINQLVWVTTR